jgi:hypothetical protein
MARNRDPFTLAFASIRDHIQTGELAGGAPIIVIEEARRLQMSTTPVREALARLCGEGLVERATSGGYVALRLDAAAARDRYVMQHHYLHIAIDPDRQPHRPAPPAPSHAGTSPGLAVDALFNSVVSISGSTTLWDAFSRVSGQLAVLRGCEPFLFGDLKHEADSLYEAYSGGLDARFAQAVAHYHDRRLQAVGALTALSAGGCGVCAPGQPPDD